MVANHGRLDAVIRKNVGLIERKSDIVIIWQAMNFNEDSVEFCWVHGEMRGQVCFFVVFVELLIHIIDEYIMRNSFCL